MELCSIVLETNGCGLNPCRNGGKCTKGRTIEDYICTCADMFSGTNCEKGLFISNFESSPEGQKYRKYMESVL